MFAIMVMGTSLLLSIGAAKIALPDWEKAVLNLRLRQPKSGAYQGLFIVADNEPRWRWLDSGWGEPKPNIDVFLKTSSGKASLSIDMDESGRWRTWKRRTGRMAKGASFDREVVKDWLKQSGINTNRKGVETEAKALTDLIRVISQGRYHRSQSSSLPFLKVSSPRVFTTHPGISWSWTRAARLWIFTPLGLLLAAWALYKAAQREERKAIREDLDPDAFFDSSRRCLKASQDA